MRILISNDDGIHASGIRALIKALSTEHQVYVIAPDRERSAMGHALTLHKPLRVDEVNLKELGAKKAWETTGTPGDCVKIGINAILKEEELPELIISGINHGPNLGADVLYSGTVSAAVEGAVLGYPSIAVSLPNGNDWDPSDFTFAADFVLKYIIPKVKKIKFPKKTILNVNVPPLDSCDVSGVAITKLGTRMYTDSYEKRIDPRGKTYYWLAGEIMDTEEEMGTDIIAIRDNKISITPVTFEMTHSSIMNELEKTFCEDGICDWFN